MESDLTSIMQTPTVLSLIMPLFKHRLPGFNISAMFVETASAPTLMFHLCCRFENAKISLSIVEKDISQQIKLRSYLTFVHAICLSELNLTKFDFSTNCSEDNLINFGI